MAVRNPAVHCTPTPLKQQTHLGAEIKDPTKFGGKKSKAAAKKGVGNTQWDILKMSGIPEDEIPQVRWERYLRGGGCGAAAVGARITAGWSAGAGCRGGAGRGGAGG